MKSLKAVALAEGSGPWRLRGFPDLGATSSSVKHSLALSYPVSSRTPRVFSDLHPEVGRRATRAADRRGTPARPTWEARPLTTGRSRRRPGMVTWGSPRRPSAAAAGPERYVDDQKSQELQEGLGLRALFDARAGQG